MLSVSAGQMKEIDRRTIEEFGIAGSVLMENAGRAVADEVLRYCSSSGADNIAVFCGGGNNGGDGFVTARRLINNSMGVTIYLLSPRDNISFDAKDNYDTLCAMGCTICEIHTSEELLSYREAILSTQLIVDALLGTGIRGEVTGIIKETIIFINNSGKHVISVDIPSGLNADTGQICAACIQASKTVTFAIAKHGLLTEPGKTCTGQLIVADIGIPSQLIMDYIG